MVRVLGVDRPGPVELLGKQHPGQPVGQGEAGQAERFASGRPQVRVDAFYNDANCPMIAPRNRYPPGVKQTRRSYTTPHPRPVIRRSQRPIPRFRQPRKTAMGQPDITACHRPQSLPGLCRHSVHVAVVRYSIPRTTQHEAHLPRSPATAHTPTAATHDRGIAHQAPPYATQNPLCQEVTRFMGPAESLAAQPATPSRQSPRNTSGAGRPTS